MAKKKATHEDIIGYADAGLGVYKIATALNNEGLKNEAGKLWKGRQVLAWFDRIPDEFVRKNWPEVMKTLHRHRAKRKKGAPTELPQELVGTLAGRTPKAPKAEKAEAPKVAPVKAWAIVIVRKS